VNDESPNSKPETALNNHKMNKDQDAKTRKIFTIVIAGVIIFGIIIFTAVALYEELRITEIERFYGTWESSSNSLTFYHDGTCKIYNYTGLFEISSGKLFINYTGVTPTFLLYEYSFSDNYNILTLTGSSSWEPRIYTKQ
jgi:hypothetical protein